MDEGGFIIDYIMPAGSSLAEPSRDQPHRSDARAIHQNREHLAAHWLQLGLAAVTEANTGDISVKLKGKRERAIDDVISDVRGKINNRNLPMTSNSFRSPD